MKLTIELTDKQMEMLRKRSEQMNSDPESLAKEMLSVITDGSEEEFDHFLFMYAAIDSPESLEELDESDDDDFDDDDDDDDIDDEFDNEDYDDEFDEDDDFPVENYEEDDWEDEEEDDIDDFLRKSRFN